MNENLRQRDDAIRKKDEKIRELTFQVNILQQELRLKNQRLAQGFGLESNNDDVKGAVSKSAHSSNKQSSNKVIVSEDDTAVANNKPSVSATQNNNSDKARSKRPALTERTNSLSNDVPAAIEVKKSVRIADSAPAVNEKTATNKTVQIDA